MIDRGVVDQALVRWFTTALDGTALKPYGPAGPSTRPTRRASSGRLAGRFALPLALGGGSGTLGGRELDLAQPDRSRCHLDAFVVTDEFERLLERERAGWDQPDELVRRGRPHVGQLLRLRRVDVEILASRVLAHDHPLVELVARRDEERAALLQVLDCEAGCLPASVGDEAPGRPCAELAEPPPPALEDVVHDPRPTRLGQELRSEADQAARRHEI